MLYIGVDIIEIPRIQAAVDRWGSRFLSRIYTKDELSYCKGKAPQLAGRFAAKEATMKALGTGLRGFSWQDIEILRKPGHRPTVSLHGKARRRAQHLGIVELAVTLSHSRNYAVASVVAQSKDPL